MSTDAKPQYTIGKTEGPHFDKRVFDDYVRPLADELLRTVPGTAAMHVWYERADDFYRIRFELDGHTYTARYYKIWAVIRDGDDDFLTTMRFYGEHRMLAFFQMKQHLRWEELVKE